MIIVADTSPINYLILIQAVDILPRLYRRVLVPPGAFNELAHPEAPGSVREWMTNQPSWLEVVAPKNPIVLSRLDRGEGEAIALAAEMRAGVLLIDDYAGRQEATRRGLKVAGTLSVLEMLIKPDS